MANRAQSHLSQRKKVLKLKVIIEFIMINKRAIMALYRSTCFLRQCIMHRKTFLQYFALMAYVKLVTL